MAKTNTASLIVPFLLKRGNYESWSCYMIDYLVSQELWDGIIVPFVPSADHPLLEESEVKKRNAAALNAIKSSCGPESFNHIRWSTSALGAWDHLILLHMEHKEYGCNTNTTPEITTSMIVPELLRSDDNYERWSICMKSYLLSQDLWDAVLHSCETDGLDKKEWIKKDAAALHAIQISCGAKVFDKIKHMTSSKKAWNFLEKKHRDSVPDYLKDLLGDRTRSKILQNAIDNGDVDAVKEFFMSRTNQDTTKLEFCTGYTALNYATMVDKLDIIKALVEDIHPVRERIIKKDKYERTALSYAAGLGKTEVAEYLLSECSTLLHKKDDRTGDIPVVTACKAGHEKLTNFLYSKLTSLDILLSETETGKQGSNLLMGCFDAKRFDIMFDVIYHCQNQSLINECWKGLLDSFARTPTAFVTGSGLTFWQRWIYDQFEHIYVRENMQSTEEKSKGANYVAVGNELLQVLKPREQRPSNSCVLTVNQQEKNQQEKNFQEIPLPGRLWRLASILLPFLGIKRIHAQMLSHIFARASLRLIFQHLSDLQMVDVEELNALKKSVIGAIENGILDFITEMAETNADLLFLAPPDDESIRNPLMNAIAFRQEKIARYIIGLPLGKTLINAKDKQRNNVLHVAGELASDFQLSRFSGAALKLQRELQWFKEVKEHVAHCQNLRNKKGETAYQVFHSGHKDLLKEAEDWMRGLASSYIIVGALIITVMFAAALTLPGGNDPNTGFPTFKNEASFMIYIISDAISLFAAAVSVVIFLGFLTARYDMEEFHKSIPTKLMAGIFVLFVSLAAMMIAFCSALFLMLQRQGGIIIPSTLLAAITVGLFAWLQFPLLFEIYVLTYRSPIFQREKNLGKQNKNIFLKEKEG